MEQWNKYAKRILKSELVKKGITNEDLAVLLNKTGAKETKASIDSKISRGTFSASFFFQCMSVIKCTAIYFDENVLSMAAEPMEIYKK